MATTAIAVRERPILFSDSMVHAILEGRKRQTRRICKYFITGPNPPNASTFDMYESAGRAGWVGAFGLDGTGNATQLCPYGRPADRLWVRETFRSTDTLEYEAYRADLYTHRWNPAVNPDNCTWRPSIFMPRRLSRITLEITKVRVERVQQITEKDGQDEGVMVRDVMYPDEPHSAYSYVEQFKLLWNEINEKRGFGWEANPFVWVIEFRRVMP